ncbi:Glycosyltransferase involved in cell wall bisynthesis [Microbacterium sp. cf046]|uniref:glycosyltransferase family 4 protein n=1 Tax=Microbacterium sp. cf046 TaxID=1761803 RepID=UPI0008EB123E|nr:glycosyltransferase family 4 protein [Microbacterium sp. cf046]SFR90902.1 Glycosyltransferase involved in cell wall bisynthesis [Microbacterium sp. cf046]
MSAEPHSDGEGGVRALPRIALISSSFAPAVGGVEEAVRQLANGLRSNGHSVEVWTVDRDGSSAVGDVDGITVRYLPAPLPARSLGSAAHFARAAPSAWREWKRAFRTFQPAILHVHCFGPNGLYALAVRRRFGRPLVLTSHGETIADDGGVFGRSALLRRGLRRAIARTDAVTAPSDVVLEDLIAHYGLRRGVVIPNGVDLTVTVERRSEEQPTLVAVGRLGHMKGFDLLLRAFAAAELEPEVRLVIGGDGPERGSLESLVASLGLGARVELRGWMPAAEVAEVMAGALAVVVPSRMEAFGIVALEAWRSAAPLVMTDRGGARSFVHDGVDGILIDPEDTERFAAVLRRLVDDPALRRRLSDAGTIRVRDFGWDGIVARYEDLYARTGAVGEDR